MVNSRSSLLPAIVTCTLALATPRGARADETATTAAEAAFEEGKRLMGEGKHAEACTKLAESQRLAPGSGTLLWLGECYEKTGRTASAWTTYKKAASLSASQGKVDREKLARERVAKLEAVLVKLTVTVPSAAPGQVVKLDGVEIGQALWGTAMPIDPGRHAIEASAGGRKPHAQQVEVTSALTVTLPPLEQAQGATTTGAPPPETPPQATPAPRDGGTGRVVGYSLIGAGALAAGIGVVLQVSAKGKADEANANNDKPAFESAQKQQTAALVTVGLGAALLTTGLVVVLTRSDSSSARLSVSPVASHDTWGLSLRGSL